MWHEGVEGAEGCGGLRGEDVAAAVRMGCVIGSSDVIETGCLAAKWFALKVRVQQLGSLGTS